jgi:hypothetical protein
MPIYEHIPTLVVDTVRTLYRESYVDMQAATHAQLGGFVDTHHLLADIKVILTQLGLVLSVLFGAFIVFIALQRRALTADAQGQEVQATPQDGEPPAIVAGVLRDRWNGILAHLDSTRESDWKTAVLEADKLVDDALAKAGFPGATFGDRLSNIQPEALLSLDGVWWAHKVRNRLAHEVDYFLRYTEARQAVGYFEAALAELQLI